MLLVIRTSNRDQQPPIIERELVVLHQICDAFERIGLALGADSH
jgi:hypothetical protein